MVCQFVLAAGFRNFSKIFFCHMCILSYIIPMFSYFICVIIAEGYRIIGLLHWNYQCSAFFIWLSLLCQDIERNIPILKIIVFT